MQTPQDRIENGTTLQKCVQKKQLQKAGGAGTRGAPHAVEQEGFQVNFLPVVLALLES